MDNNKLYGTVLLKAQKILDFISTSPYAPTLSEIDQNIDISKSTILKILQTLEYCGYITINPRSKQYYLGVKFLQYATSYSNSQVISKISEHIMIELRDRVSETINIGILQNKKVVLIKKLESPQSIQLVSREDGTMELYSSSLGKAILACFSKK